MGQVGDSQRAIVSLNTHRKREREKEIRESATCHKTTIRTFIWIYCHARGLEMCITPKGGETLCAFISYRFLLYIFSVALGFCVVNKINVAFLCYLVAFILLRLQDVRVRFNVFEKDEDYLQLLSWLSMTDFMWLAKFLKTYCFFFSFSCKHCRSNNLYNTNRLASTLNHVIPARTKKKKVSQTKNSQVFPQQ